MPAAVETMAYVKKSERDVPWHRLGTPVGDLMDDEQVLAAAGLDWEVDLRPVYTLDGEGKLIEVPGRRATVRRTDNKVLGDVGTIFHPLQNREMIEFGSVFAHTTAAKWDTAGSLNGGKNVWAMFRLDATDLVVPGGDEVWSWMLLSNSHDGNSSLTGAVVKVRVVCANTQQLALKTARRTFKIRHTPSMQGKVAQAREALELSTRYDAAFQKEVEKLLAIEVGDEKFDRMVDEVILPASTKARAAGRIRSNQAAKRDALKSWARTTETVDDSYRETGWGRLQAVTEWAQWGKSLTMDKRVERGEQEFRNVMSGPAAEIEATTHKALLALA